MYYYSNLNKNISSLINNIKNHCVNLRQDYCITVKKDNLVLSRGSNVLLNHENRWKKILMAIIGFSSYNPDTVYTSSIRLHSVSQSRCLEEKADRYADIRSNLYSIHF